MKELNEELEENHVQTEHDLREEIDMMLNKKREVRCLIKNFKSLKAGLHIIVSVFPCNRKVPVMHRRWFAVKYF